MRAAAIESLFCGEVVVECGDPGCIEGELHPLEHELIGRAVESRAREIVAGRVLARRALERLGVSDQPLLRDESRAPIWPQGCLGSISHTHGYCAVAVARAGSLLGLGLDVEAGRDLHERLLPLVCTAEELELIDLEPREERAFLGKLAFSAKESVFKCQYPLARRWLGFRDVVLSLDVPAGRFEARITRSGESLWPEGTTFEGRFAVHGELVVTTAQLSAVDARAERARN